jgi:hypothetical protein
MSPTSKNPMASLVASKAAGARANYPMHNTGHRPPQHYALLLGRLRLLLGRSFGFAVVCARACR